MKKTIYKKSKLNFTLFPIFGFFYVLSYYNIVSIKPIIFAFVLIICLLFYKLTIEIDNKFFSIYLGIGLIRKRILISEISIENLSEVDMKWYYGVGVRVTDQGLLYNVSFFGKAILIKTKDTRFLVETSDYANIVSIINNIKN